MLIIIFINAICSGGCLVAFFIELWSTRQLGWLWFFGLGAVVNLGLAFWGNALI